MKLGKVLLGVALLSFAATACGDGDGRGATAGTGGGAATGGTGGTGGSSGTSGTGGSGAESCQLLELAQFDYQRNQVGQATGVRFPIKQTLGDRGLIDALIVEVYDSTTEGLGKLVPGTFDLSAPLDAQLATCQHCVYVWQDEQFLLPPGKTFHASRGAMTITAVDDPYQDQLAGSLSGVVLEEVTVGSDGRYEKVAGGGCFRTPDVAFDTYPKPGAPCVRAEDCGNPFMLGCNPDSKTCTSYECDPFDAPCASGEQVCVPQYGTSNAGMCLDACSLTGADTCGPTRTCQPRDIFGRFGVCVETGTGALGSTCEPADLVTQCVDGAACLGAPAECRQFCRFQRVDPGCPSGQVCDLFQYCKRPSELDVAEENDACAATAAFADSCGADSTHARGLCFAFREQDPLLCRRICVDDGDCQSTSFCAQRFDTGLKLCEPRPVCGDGVLGEIDEVCDDGNRVDGDGCSQDCKLNDRTKICADRTPLSLTAPQRGSTRGGAAEFSQSCQLGPSQARLYSVAVPGKGRLSVELQSTQAAFAVGLRTSCDDAASELGCESPRGDQKFVYDFTGADPVDATLVVSGLSLVEVGDYELRAKFEPQVCGDRIRMGDETCDDGNTTSSDGCSADCSTVEYAVLCAAATPIGAGQTLSGDSRSGINVYAGECTARESSTDRLYTFTAPRAGKLTLTLTPEPVSDPDLVLTVFRGCGAPDSMTELGCSGVYAPSEVVEVELQANETVTGVVDGFLPGYGGAYTLEAAFQ
jgi:cysteine-rich repeat protein